LPQQIYPKVKVSMMSFSVPSVFPASGTFWQGDGKKRKKRDTQTQALLLWSEI